MSVSSEKIVSAPISLSELASLFGCKQDVGTICTSNNINKWAIYKPQDFSKLDLLTLDERKSKNMGLSAKELSILKTNRNATETEVRAGIEEWGYIKPKGGSTSPYRIHDFLKGDSVSGYGYNHKAKPCDSDWVDLEVAKTTSSGVVGIENATIISKNYTLRVGEETTSFDNMPLGYVVGLTGDWRLAFAVYVQEPDGIKRWHIVIGNKSLNDSSATSDNTIPNFSTNRYLCYLLKTNTSTNTAVYPCIPCLVQVSGSSTADVVLSTTEVVDSAQYSSISLNNSNVKVYCMPSGTKAFNLYVNVPISNDSSGKIIGNYIFHFPVSNSRAEYLVKGYVNSKGRTTGGWFATDIATNYISGTGFSEQQIIIAYASVDTEGNLDFTATPPSSESINITLNYTGAESTQGGSVSGSVVINTTLSKTTKVSVNVSNSSGGNQSVQFYGYLTDKIGLAYQVSSGKNN